MNLNENEGNRKRRKVVYIHDTFDIDYDEYSEDKVEIVDGNDKELPPNYRELLYTKGPIESVYDDGSSSKPTNESHEPEKFLNDKVLKFDVVNRLLDIRDCYRKECEGYIMPTIYPTAVRQFNFMCSHYGNEELKQLRKARGLKGLLYNKYKDGGYYYIVKLFDK